MGLNIILRLGIAFVAVGFIANMGLPIVYHASYELSIWDDMPVEALQTRDNTYNMYSIFPVYLGVIMIIWGIFASVRKDEQIF